MRKITLAPLLPSLLGALLAISLLAPPAGAQDWSGRGRVQGSVVDAEGNPIEGATILLRRDRDDPDSGPKPLETNKRGRWSYLGLGHGAWTVIIDKEGYLGSEGLISVSEFGSNPAVTTVLAKATVENVQQSMSPEQQQALEEAQQKAAEMRAQLEEGNRLLQAGDAAGARAAYESLLPEMEGDDRTQLQLAIARTWYMQENSEQALATLDAILAEDPDHVEALKLASSLLVAEGRSDDAQAYLARLPEGEKLDPNALLNVGIEKFNANDLVGAIEQYDTIVDQYPTFSDVYYYRGLAKMGQGDSAGAIADFEKLLELGTDAQKQSEAEQFLEYLKSQ